MSESITAQQVFDTIVKKASEMKSQCLSEEGDCVYRDGANACFVGHLLKDDEVPPNTESPYGYSHPFVGGVQDLLDAGHLPERLEPHINLLDALQYIHDDDSFWKDRNAMKKAFILIAKSRGLNYQSIWDYTY